MPLRGMASVLTSFRYVSVCACMCACVHVCVCACMCDMCVCGWLGGRLMEAADCIQLYKNPVCVVCV